MPVYPNYAKEVDDYIEEAPEEIRNQLKQMRGIIHEEAPEITEKIGYGMPTFMLNGKNVIHFAYFKKHIGLYPTPKGIEAFKERLKSYKTSKGAIQFPLNQAFPLELFTDIVKARVKEGE